MTNTQSIISKSQAYARYMDSPAVRFNNSEDAETNRKIFTAYTAARRITEITAPRAR
ncbi:MAG: hypothetical protein ABR585_12565 [Gemmatimonadaceae bacterium]